MKDNATANREAIHNEDRNQPPEAKQKREVGTMRIANKELQAMAKIDEIMAGLGSDAAVDRVMHWLNSTYAPPKRPEADLSHGAT